MSHIHCKDEIINFLRSAYNEKVFATAGQTSSVLVLSLIFVLLLKITLVADNILSRCCKYRCCVQVIYDRYFPAKKSIAIFTIKSGFSSNTKCDVLGKMQNWLLLIAF